MKLCSLKQNIFISTNIYQTSTKSKAPVVFAFVGIFSSHTNIPKAFHMDKWDLWSTSVTLISDKIEVFCASLSWPECFESCEAGIAGIGWGWGWLGGQ